MKKAILVLSLVLLSACKADLPTPSILSNPISTTKFTGTITDVNNACSYDGICGFKVDNTWVEVLRGGWQPPDAPRVKVGQIIGNLTYSNESLNKKVEVYGQKSNSGGITIYGNTDYYIKVLD